MNYRTLGSSGIQISPVCLGTMTFGSPVGEADAVKLVHEAMDLGINFIDTANAYEGYDRVLGSAGGVAEGIVGKALKGRREQAVLATKACAPVGPGPLDRGLSACHILREVDRSLERMKTDYIDLFIIHWPDKLTPLETTLAALDSVVRQGKVRCIGASNHSAAQLCEFLWLADRQGWARMVSSQIPLSLLLRSYESDLAFCEKHGIGVTPYQSLQGGLLTGKYKRGQPEPGDSRAAEKPGWVWPRDEAMYDQLEGMEKLAAEIDVSPAQYALAWALSRPAVSSLVMGAKRIGQVQDAIGAADVSIPDGHLDRIDALFPPPWQQMDPIRG